VPSVIATNRDARSPLRLAPGGPPRRHGFIAAMRRTINRGREMTSSLSLDLRISARLILGFSVICAMLSLAVEATIFMIPGVSQTADRLVNLRMPDALEVQKFLATVRAA
jgi:hypothetical protein